MAYEIFYPFYHISFFPVNWVNFQHGLNSVLTISVFFWLLEKTSYFLRKEIKTVNYKIKNENKFIFDVTINRWMWRISNTWHKKVNNIVSVPYYKILLLVVFLFCKIKLNYTKFKQLVYYFLNMVQYVKRKENTFQSVNWNTCFLIKLD